MVPGFFNITSLTLTPGFAPVVRIMMVPAPYAPCPRTLRTSSSTALVPKAFGGPLGSLRLISLKLRIFGTLLFLVRLGLLRRCDLQSLLACSGTFGNAGMRSSSTRFRNTTLQFFAAAPRTSDSGKTGFARWQTNFVLRSGARFSHVILCNFLMVLFSLSSCTPFLCYC